MSDTPALTRLWETVRQFTLCNETGAQAESGVCPVHGGDACLSQYVQVRALNVALEEWDAEARAERDRLQQENQELGSKLAFAQESERFFMAESERLGERCVQLQEAAEGAEGLLAGTRTSQTAPQTVAALEVLRAVLGRVETHKEAKP